jgi:hypothetical protein
VEGAAVQRTRPDDQAVVRLLRVAAQPVDLGDERGQPVGLVTAQVGDAPASAASAAIVGVSSPTSCRSASIPVISPLPLTTRSAVWPARPTVAPMSASRPRRASPAWVVSSGQPGTVTVPPVTRAAARKGAALDRSGSTTQSRPAIGPGSTRQTSGSVSSTATPAVRSMWIVILMCG